MRTDSEHAGGGQAPARRDGRSRDTRERIHTVALDLFISQGFGKTTMQDIADQLGLTKAAMYYHFPTKRDLIRSVVQPAVDDVNRFLTEVGDLGLARRELLERFFDLNYHHRAVFRALTVDPSALAEVDLNNWVPRIAETFQQLLLGPDASNDGRVRVVMMANGLSRVATLFADIPYEELRSSAVTAGLRLLDPVEPA